MRVVLQRVSNGAVVINQRQVGAINQGFVLLVGFTHDDTKEIVDKVVDKIMGLRIFEDELGKMNTSILDVGGSILSISQFTLYADYRKGKRPNFINAAKPEVALPLYEYFNQRCRQFCEVATGEFGAQMQVTLENDGPVTIVIDSDELINSKHKKS